MQRADESFVQIRRPLAAAAATACRLSVAATVRLALPAGRAPDTKAFVKQQSSYRIVVRIGRRRSLGTPIAM
jgi:hypothetical protein